MAALTVLLSVGAAIPSLADEEEFPSAGAMPGVQLNTGSMAWAVFDPEHHNNGNWFGVFQSGFPDTDNCNVTGWQMTPEFEPMQLTISTNRSCDGADDGRISDLNNDRQPFRWYVRHIGHSNMPLVWFGWFQTGDHQYTVHREGDTLSFDREAVGSGETLKAWWWDDGSRAEAVLVEDGGEPGLWHWDDPPGDVWAMIGYSTSTYLFPVHSETSAAPPTQTQFDAEEPGVWTDEMGGGDGGDETQEGILAAITNLWNWFSNIDDWVKGLFTASQDTRDGFEDRKSELMARAPFVWVQAPLDWLEEVIDPNTECYSGPIYCADQFADFEGVEGTHSLTGPATQDFQSAVRPVAGALLYGTLFVGLGMMVFRRLLPGSDG